MIIIICLFGLVFGSFINALVWRVYKLDDLKVKKNKKSKQASRKLESEKIAHSIIKGRSMCVHCKHQLSAKDLVPVISWVSLRGRCRYCKKAISWQYPLVELLTAAIFAISFLAWPLSLNTLPQYLVFATWLPVVVVAVALAVYDTRWMLLPTRLVYILGSFGFIFVVAASLVYSDISVALSALIGAAGFGGFFYGLYVVSGGKWIGGGDVRLGFALGLILGWQKSILALTAAAYGGTLFIVVLIVVKKYHRKMKIPFGPFLLSATIATMLWGQAAIDWYLRLSGL
jgi:prepilin signal peptidase PulO-like enzyme (type II secretory pathway)